MRAAARMRSVPASDVPPNFTTITTLPLPCVTCALPLLSSERGSMPDYTKGHSQPVVGSGHLQTRRHDTTRFTASPRRPVRVATGDGPGPRRPAPRAARRIEQTCVVASLFDCRGEDTLRLAALSTGRACCGCMPSATTWRGRRHTGAETGRLTDTVR